MRPGFHRLLIGNSNAKLSLSNELAPYNEQEWDELGLSGVAVVPDEQDNLSALNSSDNDHADIDFTEADFSLLDFPVEVIAHIFSFLDKETLFSKCSLLCSRLHRLLKSRNFWATQLEKRFTPSQIAWISSLSNNNFSSSPSLPPSIFVDYGRLVVCQPFRRNLIKNCCGELKSSEHWTLSHSGECQLAVEINKSSMVAPGIGVRMTMAELGAVPRPKWLDLPASNCCFATSFANFDMEQVVDFYMIGCQTEILDVLHPPIAIGEWMASPFSSELMYRLDVFLLNECGVELARHSCQSLAEESSAGQWRPLSYVFTDYPAGVRRLLFRHSATDPRLSCDHYGAKFAGATVKLLFPPGLSP